MLKVVPYKRRPGYHAVVVCDMCHRPITIDGSGRYLYTLASPDPEIVGELFMVHMECVKLFTQVHLAVWHMGICQKLMHEVQSLKVGFIEGLRYDRAEEVIT